MTSHAVVCPADCEIVSSRLHIVLDDILWVLTDSQMKAAIIFMDSLRDIIQQSSQQSKRQAAEKRKVPLALR